MGSIESKHEQKDDLKKQVQNYNDQLQRALIGCNQARKTFSTLSDLWCESRLETVQTISEVADSIDRHHRNVNIANLGGTSSCVAGSTAGIASIILAPVSGGISVALAAGGIFGTVAGSATVLAANMAEVCLTRELMEKVQRTLDADEIYTKALRAAFKEVIIHENEVVNVLNSLRSESVDASSPGVENLINSMCCIFNDDEDFLQQLKKTKNLLVKEMPCISETVPTSSEFFQALKEFSSIGPVEETLKRIGEAAVQSSTVTTTASGVASSIGAQVVALGLGAVFVAIDLHNLVKTSKNYDEGSKTELAQKMRVAVTDLQREYEQVSHLNSFFLKWT